MNHHKYIDFTTDQLAGDADFQRWVLNPAPEDLLFWQQFLGINPAQTEKVITAQQLVKTAYRQAPKEGLPPERKKLLHNRLMNAVQKEKRRQRVRRVLSWSSAAAAGLLLVLALAFWSDWFGKSTGLLVVQTPFGQTETVLLPDGSRVVLNANSTLSYAEEWKQGADRQVWLTGEAHFTVQPQPATQAKFTVITDDLSIHVLGTVFNVYARKQGTEVTLEEGKVTLDLKNQPDKRASYQMQPGEQVRFSAQTGELIEEQVDAAALNSWKDGIIFFDGITLGELGKVITETFGVKVKFQQAERSRQIITGAGPADDLELLLNTVEKAFGITIERQDTVLIFK